MEQAHDMTGWIVRQRGYLTLATSSRWHELVAADPGLLDDLRQGQPVRLRVGDIGDRLKVHEVVEAWPAGELPGFVAHPPSEVLAADRLRAAAANHLRAEGFREVFIPSLWRQTEEYGEEELAITHPELPSPPSLVLLQSPELPMMAALAEGFDRVFTFARCFRFEAGSGQEHRSHLMEFEQLNVAMSFSCLDEILDLTDSLVVWLASHGPNPISRRDFARTAYRATGGDGLVVATLPAAWPPRAVSVVVERLRAAGASVDAIDDGAGLGTRLLIQPGHRAEQVFRVLEVVEGHVDGPSSLLNPTWYLNPPSMWREDERHGSSHLLRSFTSQRFRELNDIERFHEAELHMGGVEVAHANQYVATAEAFLANLAATSVPNGAERFQYITRALPAAPPGMVGVALGWERLVSCLHGTIAAGDCQLFATYGDGTNPYLLAAEQ